MTIIWTVAYFYPVKVLTDTVTISGNWGIVISAYAMGYGLISLIRRNITVAIKSKGRQIFHLWSVVVAVVTVLLGAIGGINQPNYQWIYQNVYTPLGAVLYSFSFIYTVSATIRVFKVRGLFVTIFLIAGMITLVGDMTFVRTYLPFLGELRHWAVGPGSTGPYVAFNMSLGIGTLLYAYRTITGSERGWAGIIRGITEE